jgi:hypothetical protein
MVGAPPFQVAPCQLLQVLRFCCCPIFCMLLRVWCSPLAHAPLRWMLALLPWLQHLLLLQQLLLSIKDVALQKHHHAATHAD